MTACPFVCYNRKSLERILPHRGAALHKIDGVFYGFGGPPAITGLKEVRPDDRDLEGHFPGAPTYPGYAQDEFVCLVAAALIPLACEDLREGPRVVQKSVRYKRTVGPGDTLIAEVRLEERRSKFFIYTAELRNQRNELVAEYERIVGAVADRASNQSIREGMSNHTAERTPSPSLSLSEIASKASPSLFQRIVPQKSTGSAEKPPRNETL
jgi:3-hydroxymyristoyl/3-hydroxydecanoyl-(acyl carrier protein) dehydratase